jgi:hypothetical protein
VTTAGTGKLDLTNNSLVVRNSNLAAVQNLIKQAFNNGSWSGPGITSSTAAANAIHLTALGVASNADLNLTSFKGVTGLTTGDVFVKYTYYGDADLNGVTTLDDFTLFLRGYQNAGTTWFKGDFDYSGTVTLDDFTLFLLGYQQQGAALGDLEALIDSVPMSSAERAAMLAAVGAVPEPAGVVVVMAGCLALRRRARRTPPKIQ